MSLGASAHTSCARACRSPPRKATFRRPSIHALEIDPMRCRERSGACTRPEEAAELERGRLTDAPLLERGHSEPDDHHRRRDSLQNRTVSPIGWERQGIIIRNTHGYLSDDGLNDDQRRVSEHEEDEHKELRDREQPARLDHAPHEGAENRGKGARSR